MKTWYILLAAVAVVTAVAVAAVVIMDSDGSAQEYRFQTYEVSCKDNVELPVYYGDYFFKKPSTEMNGDLMAFALGLELSSGIKANDRSASVLNLLKEIGCEDARPNDVYSKVPTIETTDVAIGSKEWKGYNLIFVVLNGTRYSNESAANVMLGAEGNHQGFMYACNAGLEELREFIKDNNITGKTKILVTGYSRTAAGANLMAAYIADAIAEGKVDERIGNIKLSKEDLYGFSFETPLGGYYERGKGMVSPTDPRYDGIWYVTNPDDPVTYVPTKNYNFVRYGQHYVIQSHDETIKTKMMDNAEYYYGEKTAEWVDMSRFKKVPLIGVDYPSEIYDGFLDRFFSELGSREYYHENIEEDFVQFIYVLENHPDVLMEILNQSEDLVSFVKALYNYSGDQEKFDEYFGPIVKAALAKYHYEYYSKNVLNSFYQIANLVRSYFEGGIASIVLDPYIMSALFNLEVLLMPHLPSMTYCYIIQESSFYEIPAESDK